MIPSSNNISTTANTNNTNATEKDDICTRRIHLLSRMSETEDANLTTILAGINNNNNTNSNNSTGDCILSIVLDQYSNNQYKLVVLYQNKIIIQSELLPHNESSSSSSEWLHVVLSVQQTTNTSTTTNNNLQHDFITPTNNNNTATINNNVNLHFQLQINNMNTDTATATTANNKTTTSSTPTTNTIDISSDKNPNYQTMILGSISPLHTAAVTRSATISLASCMEMPMVDTSIYNINTNSSTTANDSINSSYQTEDVCIADVYWIPDVLLHSNSNFMNLKNTTSTGATSSSLLFPPSTTTTTSNTNNTNTSRMFDMTLISKVPIIVLVQEINKSYKLIQSLYQCITTALQTIQTTISIPSDISASTNTNINAKDLDCFYVELANLSSIVSQLVSTVYSGICYGDDSLINSCFEFMEHILLFYNDCVKPHQACLISPTADTTNTTVLTSKTTEANNNTNSGSAAVGSVLKLIKQSKSMPTTTSVTATTAAAASNNTATNYHTLDKKLSKTLTEIMELVHTFQIFNYSYSGIYSNNTTTNIATDIWHNRRISYKDIPTMKSLNRLGAITTNAYFDTAKFSWSLYTMKLTINEPLILWRLSILFSLAMSYDIHSTNTTNDSDNNNGNNTSAVTTSSSHTNNTNNTSTYVTEQSFIIKILTLVSNGGWSPLPCTNSEVFLTPKAGFLYTEPKIYDFMSFPTTAVVAQGLGGRSGLWLKHCHATCLRLPLILNNNNSSGNNSSSIGDLHPNIIEASTVLIPTPSSISNSNNTNNNHNNIAISTTNTMSMNNTALMNDTSFLTTEFVLCKSPAYKHSLQNTSTTNIYHLFCELKPIYELVQILLITLLPYLPLKSQLLLKPILINFKNKDFPAGGPSGGPQGEESVTGGTGLSAAYASYTLLTEEREKTTFLSLKLLNHQQLILRSLLVQISQQVYNLSYSPTDMKNNGNDNNDMKSLKLYLQNSTMMTNIFSLASKDPLQIIDSILDQNINTINNYSHITNSFNNMLMIPQFEVIRNLLKSGDVAFFEKIVLHLENDLFTNTTTTSPTSTSTNATHDANNNKNNNNNNANNNQSIFSMNEKLNNIHMQLVPVAKSNVSIQGSRVRAIMNFPTVQLIDVTIAKLTGRWYYEVLLLTDGLIQIGWSGPLFKCDPISGQGVGDHSSSWAYDGLRAKKWNVACEPYGQKWKKGDIVGCMVDTDLLEITYFLNGVNLGPAFVDFSMNIAANSSTTAANNNNNIPFLIFPTISLNVRQSVRINFGQYNFIYPPHRIDGKLVKPVISAGKPIVVPNQSVLSVLPLPSLTSMAMKTQKLNSARKQGTSETTAVVDSNNNNEIMNLLPNLYQQLYTNASNNNSNNQSSNNSSNSTAREGNSAFTALTSQLMQAALTRALLLDNNNNTDTNNNNGSSNNSNEASTRSLLETLINSLQREQQQQQQQQQQTTATATATNTTSTNQRNYIRESENDDYDEENSDSDSNSDDEDDDGNYNINNRLTAYNTNLNANDNDTNTTSINTTNNTNPNHNTFTQQAAAMSLERMLYDRRVDSLDQLDGFSHLTNHDHGADSSDNNNSDAQQEIRQTLIENLITRGFSGNFYYIYVFLYLCF